MIPRSSLIHKEKARGALPRAARPRFKTLSHGWSSLTAHSYRSKAMPILDVICEADSEHEIYFLLTAYAEAVRYCDKLGTLPERITGLPFTGIDDLKQRLEEMRASFADTVERNHEVAREAIEIFCAAIERLDTLISEKSGEMPIAA
jgi:hypothetical protein